MSGLLLTLGLLGQPQTTADTGSVVRFNVLVATDDFPLLIGFRLHAAGADLGGDLPEPAGLPAVSPRVDEALAAGLPRRTVRIDSGDELRVQTLFGILDADGDRTVSPAELADADRILRQLDADRDERVGVAELEIFNDVGDLSRRRGGRMAMDQETIRPVQMVPAAAGDLAGLLIQRYDRFQQVGNGRSRDGLLDAGERGLPTGQPLDEGAVAEWLQGDAVHLLVRCRYGIDADGVGIDELVVESLSPRAALSAPTDVGAMHQQRIVRAGGLAVRLDIECDDWDWPATLAAWLADESVRADQVRAGVLRTIGRVEVEGRWWGRSLFGLLDRDRDGYLSRPELRRAVQSAAFAAGSGEPLVLGGLPRLVDLRIALHSRLAAAGRAGASPWFTLMDRNGDGVVSLGEFLGPLPDFRRMDRDADGLLAPSEADR